MRILWIAVAAAGFSAASAAPAQQTATGVVFHDANANRTFDLTETPLENIRVSNGREIVRTDVHGRYALPVGDDAVLFVVKPAGWRTPLSGDMLPQFHYVHKPSGSPPSQFPGVAPTGPLPPSVDFPLYPQKEPETFKAIFFGDPQPRDMKEVEYVYHDVVEQLIGADASFGVTLGDIAFDNLNTLEPQNRGISMIGIPWYNVIGNHDVNREARTDKDSDETFTRIFGPTYYSFDYGNVHFIVLDDVDWKLPEEGRRAPFRGGLHEDQMEFIRNDLALIPPDQMTVLMMHLPINEIGNRQELYRLLEQRPLCVSIAGHTHFQQHRFLGAEDGWKGAEPHHHIVNVTVCGSWWSGKKDENGIPHATMADGAPNGYSVMTFDGKSYDWQFFAARRPADYQMNIFAPEKIAASTTDSRVLANVFGGSERSLVEMQVGSGAEWTTMSQAILPDPGLMETRRQEIAADPAKGTNMPVAMDSPHLWRAPVPAGLAPGVHLITVRATDMFGKQHRGTRILQVE